MPKAKLKKAGKVVLKGFGFAFRGIGITFLILFVLVAGIIIALKMIWEPERVRAILVTQLEEVFRRPVDIEKVILTPQGIKLTGVKVIERLDVPGEYLLECDFALLTIKVLPLLQWRLELDNVKLVSPRINLVRDKEGTWNFSDIFVATKTTTENDFILPISLAADLIEIRNAELRIDDRLKDREYRVARFNLSVKGFDPGHPFRVSLTFDNVNDLGKRKFTTSWSLGGLVSLASFDWENAQIDADKIDVTIDGLKIKGSGRLKGFVDRKSELDLKFPALSASRLSGYAGKRVHYSVPKSRWRVKMTDHGTGKYTFSRIKVDAFPLSVNASGTLDLTGKKPRFNAKLTIPDYPLKRISDLRPKWKHYKLGGKVRGKARVGGTLDDLKLLSADISVRGFKGAFPNYRLMAGDFDVKVGRDFSTLRVTASKTSVAAFLNSFNDIGFKIELARDNLKIEDFCMSWGVSHIKLQAYIEDIKDPKAVWISGSADQLRWENTQQLINAIKEKAAAKKPRRDPEVKMPWVEKLKVAIPKDFPDTGGAILIDKVSHENFVLNNFHMLWDVRGVSKSLKYLGGNVNVGFGPGKVFDIPAVQSTNKFLKVVFIPFVFMNKMNNLSAFRLSKLYPKTLDFTRIEGDYGMRRGVITQRYFYVASPELDAYADGTMDLGKETVDMNILTRLPEYKGVLPEWWSDEQGRPAIGFRVKGNLNKPDLQPRLKKMKGDEIELAREKGFNRAKERVRVRRKLKEIFKGDPKCQE